MASSISSDEEGPSPTALATSILGLKAPLRFRHHGSTQKPHLILRRVVDSDQSSDDDEPPRVVRFSLFAQKRIEVKPGKEILLCVATEDEDFKDVPLVFEADLTPPETTTATNGEDSAKAVEKDEAESAPVPARRTLPPHVRRTWHKKVPEEAPFFKGPIATPRVSVAIQATPDTKSTSVEARPEARTACVQAEPSTSSASVQATNTTCAASIQTSPIEGPKTSTISIQTSPIEGPKTAAACIQTSPVEVFMANPSMMTLNQQVTQQNDTVTGDFGVQSSYDEELEKGHADHGRRSLSPMDLSDSDASAASTPVTSYFPASIPTTQSSLPGGSESPNHIGSNGHISSNKDSWSGRTSPVVSPTLSPVPSSYSSGERWPATWDASRVATKLLNPSLPNSETSAKPHGSESPSYRLPTPATSSSPSHPPGLSATNDTLSQSQDHASNSLGSGNGHGAGSSAPLLLSQSTMQEASTASAEVPVRSLKKQNIYDMFVPAKLTNEASIDAIPVGVSMMKEAEATKAVSSTSASPPVVLKSPIRPTPAPPTAASSYTPVKPTPVSYNAGPPPMASLPPPPSGFKLPTSTATSLPSPPTDPTQIARPASGPSTNPLNIAPSRLPAAMRNALTGAVPPSAPRSLQTMASKKPVVISANWSAGKSATQPPAAGPSAVVPTVKAGESSGEPPAKKVKRKKDSSVKDAPVASGSSLVESAPVAPVVASVNSGGLPTPPLSQVSQYTAVPPPPPGLALAPTQPVVSNEVQSPPQQYKWKPFVPSTATSVSTVSTLPASGGAIPGPSSGAFPGALPPPAVVPLPTPAPSVVGSLGNGVNPYGYPPMAGLGMDIPGLQGSSSSMSSVVSQKDLPPHIKSSAQAMASTLTATPPTPITTTKPALNGFRSAGVVTSELENLPPSMLGQQAMHAVVSNGGMSASSSSSTLVAQSTKASPIPQAAPAQSSSSGPLHHPLPARPPLPQPGRGTKRERPPSPEPPSHSHSGSGANSSWRDRVSPPVRRRAKPNVSCLTVLPSAVRVLQGEGMPYMKTIEFSADGTCFVLSCSDKTIRVWNCRERVEMARLTHHSAIVSAQWLEDDAGVVVLTDDGLVSKWTKAGVNAWKWARVLDAGNDYRSDQDPICFAYTRGRIAVSFPRMGVKVWILSKGVWQAQRSILRQNVTAIKFIDGGDALLGGTRDGALWCCDIPNGTLRAYAFLRNKIISLDLSPLGSHVLVGVASGGAALVGLSKMDNKGNIEKVYSLNKEADGWSGRNEYGATFATKGQAVIFATVDSCALVWDRKKGSVVYGLEHDEGDIIQAVAAVDSSGGREGCMVTGTKSGQVCWWALPVAAGTQSAV